MHDENDERDLQTIAVVKSAREMIIRFLVTHLRGHSELYDYDSRSHEDVRDHLHQRSVSSTLR
jgi:hypothetical protein